MKEKIFISAVLVLICTVMCVQKNKSSQYENNENDLLSEKKRMMKSKGKVPGQFSEYFAAISSKPGSKYEINYRYEAFEKAVAQSKLSSARVADDHVNITAVDSRGPGNVGGRTRAIVIDPDDPTYSTWFAGSASGGIWKTTDKGGSWENLTPDLPNLSTNALAMAPSNHDILYGGTGEGFFNIGGVTGAGIFKSVDRGESWEQLTATATDPRFENVNRFIIDPDNAGTVLAVTNGGIFKTIDGGTSWSERFSSGRRVQDIKHIEGNFNIQFASVNSFGVFKSMDAGETWAEASTGIIDGERFELAVASSNPDVVYASSYNGLDQTLLYRSGNQGESWALVEIPASAEVNGHFLAEQGWYDNCLAVNPYNENEVFIGGVYLGKFVISGDETDGSPRFTGVDLGEGDFLSFVNFGESYFGGALAIGDGDDASSDFFSVEIRFGTGHSQMAHRFTVPATGGSNGDGGAGVPEGNYAYRDYVSVPFEVWDVTNDRRLMVSFRDQQRDGVFNLNPRDDQNDPELLTAREYIFIHNVDYAASADANISAGSGSHLYQNMYFFWPTLAPGLSWDVSAVPDWTMKINYNIPVVIDGEAIAVSSGSGGRTDYGYVNSNLHVDHHNLTVIKTDESTESFMMVNGNDGGLGVSEDNGENWEQITDGYITTQFYGVDKKPGEDVYFGGMQDNGSWRSPDSVLATTTTPFTEMIAGDGFEAIWHAQDDKKIIGTSQGGFYKRTLNGGSKTSDWEFADEGIDGEMPFINRISSSRTNPDVLFTSGALGVFKSTDFGESWTLTSITPENGWTLRSQGEPTAQSSLDVEVSLANHKFVWAGWAMDTGSEIDLFVSANEGRSFSPVSVYGDGPGQLSGVYTHPFEDSTAYALFSYSNEPKIIRTTDLGQSWEDITGFEGNMESDNGFPDVMVHSLLVLPQSPETIWVGTEIGLFESTDDGGSWHYADIGLPAVSVWSMKVVDDQVVFGTHGRGIWTVTMSDLEVSQSYIKRMEYEGELTATLITDFRDNYDSVRFYQSGKWVHTEVDVKSALDSLGLEVLPTDKSDIRLKLEAFKGGIGYLSPTQFARVDFKPLIFTVEQGKSNPQILNARVILNEKYDKVEILLNGEIALTLDEGNQETGEVSLEIPLTATGSFDVVVKGYLGDFVFESSSRKVNVSSLVTSIKEESGLRLYPNPTDGMVHFEGLDLTQESVIEVFGMSGKLVSRSGLREGNGILDLTKLESGIYILRIGSSKGIITKRIVKK